MCTGGVRWRVLPHNSCTAYARTQRLELGSVCYRVR